MALEFSLAITLNSTLRFQLFNPILLTLSCGNDHADTLLLYVTI
jgi:hypothetical protein